MNFEEQQRCDVSPDRESESDIDTDDVNSSDCEYQGDDNNGDSIDTIHPVLMKDIELLKDKCGNNAIHCRPLNEICEMDLDIYLPITLLEKFVAEAWGLIYDEPVIIRLSVHQYDYLDNKYNTVKVFQKTPSQKLCVLKQLKMIVEEFCKKQFSELTNDKVKAAVEEGSDACWTDVPSHQIENLLQMGFRREDITRAYQVSDENIDIAANILLNHKLDGAYSVSDGVFPISVGDHSVSDGDHIDQSTHCVDQSTSMTFFHKAKEIPSLSNGFLVQLYLYIEQRLLTLNSFCPICDNPHHFIIDVMLKPVICSRHLCTFSYNTLGVMLDAAGIIVGDPEVVNLLIVLTKVALHSSRNKLILKPYPVLVHPSKAKEIVVHPENPNFNLLKVVVDNMPHVQEMVKCEQEQLLKKLNEKHELCYPLLRWIISSNRSHIVKLPPNMQLDFMGTCHQFLMCSSPPLQEKMFRKHKEKHGTVFAFHGSPIENWHSIIREGLVNATGTELMINGAQLGDGIYLSPHLKTSMRYSQGREIIRMTSIEQDISSNYIHEDPKFLKCIALCEVINCSKLEKINVVWKCLNTEYVCTRFFFVYDKHNKTECLETNTSTPDIHERLKEAILKW